MSLYHEFVSRVYHEFCITSLYHEFIMSLSRVLYHEFCITSFVSRVLYHEFCITSVYHEFIMSFVSPVCIMSL